MFAVFRVSPTFSRQPKFQLLWPFKYCGSQQWLRSSPAGRTQGLLWGSHTQPRTPTWGEWLSGIQCKVSQQQTKHYFLIHHLNLVCMMIYVIRILTLSKYHICFGNMGYGYIFKRTFFQKWPWNRGILCRCVPGIPAARFCASLVGFKKCDIRPVKVDEISTYPFIYTNNPSEKQASSDSDAVCRPCI